MNRSHRKNAVQQIDHRNNRMTTQKKNTRQANYARVLWTGEAKHEERWKGLAVGDNLQWMDESR